MATHGNNSLWKAPSERSKVIAPIKAMRLMEKPAADIQNKVVI